MGEFVSLRMRERGKKWRSNGGGRRSRSLPEREDNSRRLRRRRQGGLLVAFSVWVRNLPLCQPRLDIK